MIKSSARSTVVPAAGVSSSSSRRGVRSWRSWLRRTTLVVLAGLVALGTLALRAEAAVTYTQVALTATVTGSSVAVSSTVRASVSTLTQHFKVCARSATNANLDFASRTGVTVRTGGTTYTSTQVFTPGTYSYFTCLQAGDQWFTVGAVKSFTVAASTPTPAPTPTVTPTPPAPTVTPTPPAPSTGMPTTSTRPGWAYSYGQDFTTAAPTGKFSDVYGYSWGGYRGVRNDTSRNGSYQPDKVLSVSDGSLQMKLGYEAATGQYNVAAPFPQPPAGVNGGSQEYLGMRSSVRFKSSGAMPGYKVAWMLWPSTWNWNDGEIDFPEASLDSTIYGFSHQANTGNPGLNAMWAKTGSTFHEGWHVATTEWVPGKSVEFFLDGVSVGRTTEHVPTVPMHWTLQTETELSSTAPAKDVTGTISIDWLTVESWKG